MFNAQGELCGLICSSLPPSQADETHISYVTTLWPTMGTIVDMDRDGFAEEQKYPALELAQHGYITARGWEDVVLFRNETGDITKVGLSCGRQPAV